ncbi:hypothetical protein EP47_01565 [Legionella norrlandica]|uniref:Uncharacterized protein n=1 Tax=Legionella norrlandica TaxID=1498499 RepID=A0A0A2SNW9_9GAMM|nr:hypothetical protein [Legionella norrlandica]KGP62437.1 hypothetical protein EP47_01565 [Legionella norrlandica]
MKKRITSNFIEKFLSTFMPKIKSISENEQTDSRTFPQKTKSSSANAESSTITRSHLTNSEFNKILKLRIDELSQTGGIIKIKDLLAENLYSPHLSNITVSKIQSDKISLDFDGMSLKNVNFKNISCQEINLTNATLSDLCITGGLKCDRLNISKSRLSGDCRIVGSNIKNAVVENCQFDENLQLIAFRNNDDLTKKMKSAYPETTTLGPGDLFEQKNLIEFFNKKFGPDSLNETGTCAGLCVDYARYHVKRINNNTNKASDDSSLIKKEGYISKLEKKYNHARFFNEGSKEILSAKNYQAKIKNYHTEYEANYINDQNKGYENDILPLGSEPMPPKKPIHELIDELVTSQKMNIVGINLHGNGIGHSIAVRVVKDKGSAILGYMLYDPNLGEFNCVRSSLEKGQKALNQIMSTLQACYDKNNLLFVNLDKVVEFDPRKSNKINKSELAKWDTPPSVYGGTIGSKT